MKKAAIVILVLFLLLTGFFLWKGGHHAIYVSNVLEDWLDTDAADQSLSIRIQSGSFSVDSTTGKINPGVEQWSLTAETFWTEYANEEVYGLTYSGATAYLRQGVLYTDTGLAYALPDFTEYKPTIRRLCAGLLLYGRITKTGNTYTLTMNTEELDLTASVTIDRTVQMLTVSAVLPDGMILHATLTPRETQAHPIPQPVSDAMVRATMEPPMSLSEPLDVLKPTMEHLLPLSGKLKLGVSSGILKVSESMDVTFTQKKVTISKGGAHVTLNLPDVFSDLSPISMGLLALRNGSFSMDGDTTAVTIDLPGDAVTVLIESLVPQAAGLGVTFDSGILLLTITDGRLISASVTADGSVPIFFSTIPLSFSANLTIE